MKSLMAVLFLFSLVACKSNVEKATSIDSDSPHSEKIAAINKTISDRNECSSIGDFYWEIGDTTTKLASGKVGTSYDSTTELSLASASKLYFAAYVAQVKNGVFSTDDYRALQMKSGYVSFNSCALSLTVRGCFNSGSNDTLTPSAVDKFSYGGGHFQYWGENNGIELFTKNMLTEEFKSELGEDITDYFNSVQLAGGMKGSASGYALFLRKILSSELKISEYLGHNPICTDPSSCVTALSSPAPEKWHYSLGHWVENDPTTGDGAFSSPGAFGFYPWIDSSKTYYGILSRYDLANSGNPAATSSYWKSVLCGRLIRKAWISGEAQ